MNSPSISHRGMALALCAAVGALGGTALMLATHASVVAGPILGAVAGMVFALVFLQRAVDGGSGLLWGLAYALLLWLAVVPGPQVIAANLSSTYSTNRDK